MLARHGSYEIANLVLGGTLLPEETLGKIKALDKQCMEELLATETEISTMVDQCDRTPLHHAAAQGNAEMVQWLLERGASIKARDSDRYTALMLAVGKHLDVVKVLFKHGANVNETWGLLSPLLIAIHHPDVSIEMVKTLLQAGAKVDSTGEEGVTPLHQAARNGRDDIVEELLQAGAKVDVRMTWHGFTPLHWAVRDGTLDTVKALLKQRSQMTVSANQPNSIVNVTDRHGETPLIFALKANPRKDRVKIVETLIEAGADVRAKDNRGKTLYELCSESAHLGFFEKHRIRALLNQSYELRPSGPSSKPPR